MSRLLRLTLFFVAGDVLGLRWAGAAWAAIAASIAVCLLVTAIVRSQIAPATVHFAFVLLGVAAGGTAAHGSRSDCRATIPDGARLAVIGVLDGLAEPGARVTVRAEGMSIDGKAVACSGALTTRLPVRGRFNDGTDSGGSGAPGRHILLTGLWWSSQQAGVWPRPAEWAGTLSVTGVSPFVHRHSHRLVAARVAALERVRATFHAEAAMAESLLLARRERLEAGVRDDFAAAGLAHLLAISGAHVGIIGGIVLLLAGLAGLRPRAAAVAASMVTSAYVVFLGAPAAATRAAIQGLAILASRITQRPAEPLTLLAGAGLVIIAADPASALGPGFQLSFAGVFGLFTFGPPIRRSLPERVPGLLAAALAPTLAATAATMPVAALHFGLIALVGPLTNLIAAPVLSLAIPGLVTALAAGLVAPGIGSFLGQGAEVLLRLLREVAGLGAGIPLGHVRVGADSVTTLLIAAATFLACGPMVRARFQHASDGRHAASRMKTALRASLACTVVLIWPLLRPLPGGLEIHVIDVGQGDAIAIRTPRDQWILVDAGPATPSFDAGRDRVAPYLRQHGARRIDLFVLTHPDGDHIGGARALFEAFEIGTVMDPAIAAGKSLYLETLAAADRAGFRWVGARAGREIDAGDVHLRVLAPDTTAVDPTTGANDFSVVFRLEYGEFSAMFLGDAPESVEDRIVGQYGAALASDVLKVGHHGSRTSTGDSLLVAVKPAVGLISVGRRNRYGHPSPVVLDRLAMHGVRVARTDSSGSIIVRARSDGSMRYFASR